MKINYFSDLHLEFDMMKPPQTDADIIIAAGDIHTKNRAADWLLQFEKPVIYVPGNHEYYDQHFQKTNEALKHSCNNTEIFCLNRSYVVLEDCVFFGTTLWTDFNFYGPANKVFAMLSAQENMNDYHYIRYGLAKRKMRPEDTEKEHIESVVWLKEVLEYYKTNAPHLKRVVVTHHLPHGNSISLKYVGNKDNGAYASDLSHLIPLADYWIHGHTHSSSDYLLGGTRVLCNPRGYKTKWMSQAENHDFDAFKVIEI